MELLGLKVRKKVLRLTDGYAQTEIRIGDDKKVQTVDVYADVNPAPIRKTAFQTQNLEPAQVERSAATLHPFDDSSDEEKE